jgi:hypothetical protein
VSATLLRIQHLVQVGEAVVSEHDYDELASDGLFASDAIDGVKDAVVVEDYPDARRGPSVLVLQRDELGRAFHVVWGIPKDENGPAVLITAYRPDPGLWSEDFLTRRR